VFSNFKKNQKSNQKKMSHRMARTEQIGPSGHKNEYHIGVLHGNWQEERFALGRKAQGKVKFEGESEAKAQFASSYQNGSVIQKPERAFPYECPRELLFGQGPATSTANAEQQWITTAQLQASQVRVGRGGKNANNTAEELQKINSVNSIAGAKARARQQELGDDEQFKTTKQSTLDSTANKIINGEVEVQKRSGSVRARGGAITNELHTAANKIQLRK
jgi:hypothetical protein